MGEDSGTDTTVEERLARVDRLIESYGMPFRRIDVLRTIATRLLDLATYTDGRLLGTANTECAGHAAMYRRDAARAETLTVLA